MDELKKPKRQKINLNARPVVACFSLYGLLILQGTVLNILNDTLDFRLYFDSATTVSNLNLKMLIYS